MSICHVAVKGAKPRARGTACSRTPSIKLITRTKYWCWRQSGGTEPSSDVLVERLNERVPGYLEPAAQIVPDRDAELVAGLDETEESIAAVPPDVAPCAGADLAPCDLTAAVLNAIESRRQIASSA